MKIERKKSEPKFEPITITIESQAEFNALLIGLNHNTNSFKEAAHDFKLDTQAVRLARESAAKMWFKLDSISKL